MSEAYGPTSCTFGLAPESKLSRSPKVQYGFMLKISHHGEKNTALRAEKHSLQLVYSDRYSRGLVFFSDAKRNGVFAFDDVLVSQKRVMMSGFVRELALRHRTMKSAQKLVELKTSAEGFYMFL